ncbi:TetR/AcrR family transcriptional regulator [Frankia sp. Cpl3]|nr:TetR/AcrR family transcriptional regulator [Frankia sp. Cpl3]
MAQAPATTPEQVIDAATAVFLEKGVENSTISDIARAAKIPKPTIYQYVEGSRGC